MSLSWTFNCDMGNGTRCKVGTNFARDFVGVCIKFLHIRIVAWNNRGKTLRRKETPPAADEIHVWR
jgi:hypothetical protein